MKISKKIFKTSVFLTLCGISAYLSWVYTPALPKDKFHTTLQIGGDFQLQDTQGVLRSTQEFKNRYLILYFGYGYCPDICPAALHNLSDALYKLEAEGRGKLINKIQPVFITIDPDRDTPLQLQEFISQFHPKFIALTGTKEDIKKVTNLYKVFYQKVEEISPTDSKHYLMDHSSIIYVMRPEGQYCGSFNHLTSPEEMALKLREWIV